MKFIVRTMERNDSASWAVMRHRMWDHLSVDYHLEAIERMLAGELPRTGYISVLESGDITGFAEVSICEYANGCTDEPVPFLEAIWVEPSCQKRGIGRAMVTASELDLIAQSYRELCSDAHIDNTISHHAHGQWGFGESDRVVYSRKALGEPTDRLPNEAPMS